MPLYTLVANLPFASPRCKSYSRPFDTCFSHQPLPSGRRSCCGILLRSVARQTRKSLALRFSHARQSCEERMRTSRGTNSLAPAAHGFRRFL